MHITADSTVLQDSPSWVYKGEWNGTLTQNMFAEFRAGQFGYNFGLDSNTDGTRYEDLVTNEVRGGGRDWLNKRRRNQYTGALSYFKDNFAGGSHNFKFGGEYLDENGNMLWDSGLRRQRDPLPEQRRAQRSVRLYNSGTSSQNALASTSVLRHRHLDDQPPDAERGRALRSLSRVAAGADAAGRHASTPAAITYRRNLRGRRPSTTSCRAWARPTT